MAELVERDEEQVPALTALTPLERNFVELYVELGGRRGSGVKAILGAGYKTENPAQLAHKMLRKPKIIAAIRYLVDVQMRVCAASGMRTLEELAESGPAEVRLKAANSILDRAGHFVQKFSTHHIVVEDTRTDRELIARIEEIAAVHGLDPAKLVGSNYKTIEAEFEEVSPEDQFTCVPGRDKGTRKPDSDQSPSTSDKVSDT